MNPRWIIVFTVAIVVFHQQLSLTSASLYGVNYGTLGNDLPPPTDVINLFQKNKITMMRLFDPAPSILQALKGSNIMVAIGIKNQDLQSIAASQEVANTWVNTNVIPYVSDKSVLISWITAGNEIIPGAEAQYVPNAISNIYNAIRTAKLDDQIKVTTVIASNALVNSYPPSATAFAPEIAGIMAQISTLLRLQKAPLMINVYPFIAYSSNPKDIPLDYALFKSTTPVVVDGNLNYLNLFDAMVDAFIAALEKISMPDVPVIVSESGWPSAGNPFATVENAQTYNGNLIKHIQNGTPRRPGSPVQTFLFAMFNENQKQPPGVEQNFGLFYPNMSPVYPMNFTSGA